MSLIEIKNLSKVYQENGNDTLALDGVDLNIDEGEFIAIIGPSGSGKSTLLQILGCLDRPTEGQYFFDGKEVGGLTDDELAEIRRNKIGFVFQAFNLLPRLSVLENIKIPLTYSGMAEPKRTQRAEELVKLVGLEERKHYGAAKLSGGQKQRVAIARALANTPKIIFADEPTGSLDSKSGAVILDMLQKLHNEGHTIVLVTHESYVAECAQRILHIKDGKVDKDESVKNQRVVSKEGFIK